MDFNKSDLLELLETVKDCVLKTDLVPVLQNICIKGDLVIAYNCIVGCVTPFDFKGIEGLIPFDRFYKLVKSFNAENVSIKVDDNVLNIKSGRSSSSMTISPLDDFPDFIDILTESDEAQECSSELLEGILLCAPFVGKNVARMEFTGLCVNDSTVTATDGKRIAQYTCTDTVSDKSVILPIELCKIASRYDVIDGLYIADNKDKVIMVFGDTIFFTSPITGQFPKGIDKYFPNSVSKSDLPIDDMQNALIRIGDFSGEERASSECVIEIGDIINLKYEGNSAQIKEVFDFGGSLPKGRYKINPFLFSTILLSCDMVSICKIDNANCVVYGEKDEGKFKCVMATTKAK